MKHCLVKVPHKEKGRFAAHLKQIWLEPDKKSAKRAAVSLIDDYVLFFFFSLMMRSIICFPLLLSGFNSTDFLKY